MKKECRETARCINKQWNVAVELCSDGNGLVRDVTKGIWLIWIDRVTREASKITHLLYSHSRLHKLLTVKHTLMMIDSFLFVCVSEKSANKTSSTGGWGVGGGFKPTSLNLSNRTKRTFWLILILNAAEFAIGQKGVDYFSIIKWLTEITGLH